MKYIADYVTISDQMLRGLLEIEEAIARHAERMDNDPEYAAEYWRRQAECDEEDWDDR